MRYLAALFLSLLLLWWPSMASATRDLASGNYMDGGTAANTAGAASMAVGGCVKLDGLGAMQVPLFRGVTALNNGYDLRVLATSGNLSWFNYENDSADGTATTAITSGSWWCIGMIQSGSGGSGSIKFVRFQPSTGTLATEDVGMFVGPSPSGTHKLLLGGRWNGALANEANGDYARFFVASGVSVTAADMQTYFCGGAAPTGSDGVWELAGSASPEPDTSGNGYDLTLSGTSAGSALDACPSASTPRHLMLLGVGQ